MKISVFYDHIEKACTNAREMPAMLKQVRAWGVDGVYLSLDTLLANEKMLLSQLQEADLVVCGLCGNVGWSNGFSEQEARAMVDAAVRCDTDNVLFVPGFLPQARAEALRARQAPAEIAAFLEQDAAAQSIRKGLQYAVDYAADKDVKVTLEDYDGFCAPYSRTAELQWWLKTVNGLAFTLDTGNFAFNDEDPLSACCLFREKLVHVHCKDRAADVTKPAGRYSRGLLPCAVGDGYIAISEIVSYLRETGYDGALTIEHYDVTDYAEAIRRSAQYLLKV